MSQATWNYQKLNKSSEGLDTNGQSTQDIHYTFPHSKSMTQVPHYASDRAGTTSVPSSAGYGQTEFLGVPSNSSYRPRGSSFTSGSNTHMRQIYAPPVDPYYPNEPRSGIVETRVTSTKVGSVSATASPSAWNDNIDALETTRLIPQAPRTRAISGPARPTLPQHQARSSAPTRLAPLINPNIGHVYDSPLTSHAQSPEVTSFVRPLHQQTLSMPLPSPSENLYQSLAYDGYVNTSSFVPPPSSPQETQNVTFGYDLPTPSHQRQDSSRPAPNSRTTLAPSSIVPPLKRQTRKPLGTTHACISLNRTDRLRLIKFPQSAVEAIKAAISRSWPKGIQGEGEHAGSTEFQMRGNPWGGDGSEAVPAIYMMCEIMSAVYHLGWMLMMATDISKRAMDKDTLIYRQGDIPSPCVFMAVSFNDGDKLRLINASNEVINAVKNIWGGNVQRESWKLDNVAWEFKLAGQVFISSSAIF
ncbi:hypothetical protein FRC17_001305 [Serendipita sp. 399]|nr:hypothetical protein FRC17_001305 [Serendipita sp. 399]